MSGFTTRDGPNPLRPYYVPPSISVNDKLSNSAARASNTSSAAASASTFFSDLDYSDYLSDSSPSSGDAIKRLLDQALWKYTSVLMAQPFDVAKTILQTYVAQDLQDGPVTPQEYRRGSSQQREEYQVRAILDLQCATSLLFARAHVCNRI